MANKRQRKKQQAKQNIKFIESLKYDVPKKEIKRVKNKPFKEVKKITGSYNPRNIRAREREEFMKKSGLFKDSEKELISRMRWWGVDKYNAEINRRKKLKETKKKKISRQNDLYLQIYWREKTQGYVDRQLIDDWKREYRYVSKDYLIESIKGFLSKEKVPAMIGTYQIQVVRERDRQQMKAFMGADDQGLLNDYWASWMLVYEGKVQRYKEFLLGVHTVMRLLYDHSEKASFVNDLIEKYLPVINKDMGRQFAKDINFTRGRGEF